MGFFQKLPETRKLLQRGFTGPPLASVPENKSVFPTRPLHGLSAFSQKVAVLQGGTQVGVAVSGGKPSLGHQLHLVFNPGLALSTYQSLWVSPSHSLSLGLLVL